MEILSLLHSSSSVLRDVLQYFWCANFDETLEVKRTTKIVMYAPVAIEKNPEIKVIVSLVRWNPSLCSHIKRMTIRTIRHNTS